MKNLQNIDDFLLELNIDMDADKRTGSPKIKKIIKKIEDLNKQLSKARQEYKDLKTKGV